MLSRPFADLGTNDGNPNKDENGVVLGQIKGGGGEGGEFDNGRLKDFCGIIWETHQLLPPQLKTGEKANERISPWCQLFRSTMADQKTVQKGYGGEIVRGVAHVKKSVPQLCHFG